MTEFSIQGQRVCLRKIAPEDAPKLIAGLQLLSEATRYARFFFAKTGFSPAELDRLTHCDGITREAWVAEWASAAQRPLIGVARWERDPGDPERAEVAFVIRDDWQRQGLGTALLRQLAVQAQQQGIRYFHAEMLWDNVGALRVLAAIGRRVPRAARGTGTMTQVFELDDPAGA
jgi:RimJ/RimL family protein N-acetyltransferase